MSTTSKESTTGPSKPTALVVGAGIGGLAAGIALRDAGWNVRSQQQGEAQLARIA